MAPRVSVIIPNFNRRDLIGETISSILAQSLPPMEIIVVDDGSTDDSVAVVEKEFGASVRVLRQQNEGAGVARNNGFLAASGDFIQFMDSDDICAPQHLEVQVEALERTGADFAYGPWIKAVFEGNRIKLDPVALQQRAVPGQKMLSSFLRGWMTVLQPCLIRRSLIEHVGLYRTDLKPTEDLEFLARILFSGARAVHTPESLVLYRVHPAGQISIQNPSARILDLGRCLSLIQEHKERYDSRFDFVTEYLFDLQCLHAAQEISSLSQTHSNDLRKNLSFTTIVGEWAMRPLRRIESAVKRRLYGGNYRREFSVGPITAAQRQIIRNMGYSINVK